MDRFELQDAEPADLHPPQPENLTPTPPSPPVNPQRSKPRPPQIEETSRRYAYWLPALLIAAGVFVLLDGVKRVASDSFVARPTERSLAWAVAMSPSQPEAWRTRADWLDRVDGDSAAAERDLKRAVEAAPADSDLRVELASQLERDGRVEEAEKRLLEATNESRGFAARWALANFYLRQGRQDDYWTAIRDAVVVDPENTSAAAALCWRAFNDSKTILDRAMPDQPEVNRRYFAFLSALGNLEARREAWPRFLSTLEPRDISLGGEYVDGLIAAKDIDEAVEAWNALVERGSLPHGKLAPEQGQSLTNGELFEEPSALGFDWRPVEQRGVSWLRRPPDRDRSRAIEFRFNGAQDSPIVLLRQFAPVLPDRSYTFQLGYATQNMPAEPGVGWAVSDAADRESLVDFHRLPVAENYWDQTSFGFTTGPNTHLIALEFGYQAAPGVERTIGRFVLRRLQLKLESE